MNPNQLSERRRILDAATETVTESGYQSLAMRDVAALASVAIGTLYRYFPSKEELADSVVASALEAWADHLASARLIEGDSAARIAELLALASRTFMAQPNVLIAGDPRAGLALRSLILQAAEEELNIKTVELASYKLVEVWNEALEGWTAGRIGPKEVQRKLFDAVGQLFELPGTARALRPVRSEQVSEADISAFIQTVEPLLGVAENLLSSNRLSDEQQSRIAHAVRGLRHETWENPAEPASAIIASYTSTLIELVRPFLPSAIMDGAAEPIRADQAANRALDHAKGLGDLDSRRAGDAAADVADDLGETVAALEAPGHHEPTEEATRRGLRAVLQHVGWLGGLTSTGSATGATALPALAVVSPAWGAVLGALGGVLAYLFKVSVYDE